MGAATSSEGASSSSGSPEQGCIAGRYRISHTLGSGGMARVYAVHDEMTGRDLALKQMLPQHVARKPSHIELFKREYQTALQMAHPRIVEVYDYGVDEGVPYYTMELLDGSDLQKLAPVEWRRACELLRDVASGLAMMHSRRLLHRDVTPRNVRCTLDGRGKLIDFGGMTAMGIAKHVVGTPPFIAPEALRALPMDGRTDLYSLGALGYWLLAKKHAYPARSLPDLEMRWHTTPEPVSALSPECPTSLDALVQGLLSLDMMERPSSAAEVIERLNAIAELPLGDQPQVAQAYLTTPSLVGRDALLERFRAQVRHALVGHGAAVALEGEPGMGRSRVLSSCALEGQFAGAGVARASAEDADAGELGMLRALSEGLFEHSPEAAAEAARPFADKLSWLLPDSAKGSLARTGSTDAEERASDSASVAEAFIAWIRELASAHPVVLAVDDVFRADDATLAAFAALARSARSHRLVLAMTMEPASESNELDASRMVRKRSETLRLAPLSIEETERLLRSTFGDVVHVGQVARWVHEHSLGNPRMALDLARYLVDDEVARYVDGTWVLPQTLDNLGLPESLAQLLDARVRALGADARRLGGALALASPHESPAPSTYAALLAGGQDAEARVARALDELLAGEILVDARYGHTFVQSGLVEALIRANVEQKADIHRALASVYEQHDDARLIVVYHLQQAGDDEVALERVLEHVRAEEPEPERAKLSSKIRIEVLKRAEAQCDALKCPQSERLLLQRSLVRLAGGYDSSLSVYADAALERLRHDCGLIHWEDFAQTADPVERIKQCVGRAQASYEATPEAERGLDPVSAIRSLAYIAMHMTAVYSRALDVPGLRRIAALLEPLAGVSSTVGALWMVVQGAICKDTGRPTERWYVPALEKLDQPGKGVMGGQRNMKGILAFSLACDAVAEQPQRALEHAEGLERDPFFAALASEVRLLVAVHQGDLDDATRHRERRDGRSGGVRAQITRALLLEAHAYAACRDLMQLKMLLEPIEEQADRYAGWRPVLHWVRGEYCRVRGQPGHAKEELERCLELVQPGEHVAWAYAMATYLKVLLELREHELAHALAKEALEHVDRLGLLGGFRTELSSVVALAEARQRDFERAEQRINENLASLQELGSGVLTVGRHYEVLARVAIMARDREGFEAAVRNAEALYVTTTAPGLLSRARKLWRDGERRFEGKAKRGARSAEPEAMSMETMCNRLRACETSEARKTCVLEWLLEFIGGDAGYLFAVDHEGVEPAVAVGLPPASPQLREKVQSYLDQQLSDDTVTDEVPESVGRSGSVSLWRGPEEIALHVIPLRSQTSRATTLTAVTLVSHPSERSQLAEVASMLSDALLSSGDVTGIVLDN